MQVPKLFSPGPVMVRDDVRQALMHYDICHRGAEFEAMFADTQDLIKKLFSADESYYSVIVSGSGTSANEAVLSSIFKEGEQVLLIRNGLFSDRLGEIIEKYNIPMIDASFAWGEYPNADIIENMILANPNVKVVTMVFHETSTGMINPVHEVGLLCKKYNKLLFVDAVSAAGGQLVDVADNNIAIATSVGGKCVGAFPGSAFICAREDVLKSITAEQCKNVYLSLYKHYISATASSQTPNTPNVTLFWALNRALKNIEEEGLGNRVKGREDCASIIRNGIRELGLRMLIEKNMSSTVTTVFLPDGIDLEKFMRKMEDRGYVLYVGKGKLKQEGAFQIATMGEIYEKDCIAFLAELKDCLKALKNKN